MSASATMDTWAAAVETLDWAGIENQLNAEGYALLPGLLAPAASLAQDTRCLRRVSLETANLGRGLLYDYAQTLPEPLARLRALLYPALAEIANRWNEKLGIEYRYPAALQTFLQHQHAAQQTRPLSALYQLRESDYLGLHQQAEGEHVFPLQLIGLLSTPGTDFTGGEFVMTEQRPRMQSRPMVLPLRQGDAALISTAQRPVLGSKGYYRVNLKHAISRVRQGERTGLTLFFHDAP